MGPNDVAGGASLQRDSDSLLAPSDPFLLRVEHEKMRYDQLPNFKKEIEMKMMFRIAIMSFVLMLAQGVVRAQGFFGFMRGNPLMLLNQESVQKELKLNDEQKTKIDDLRQKS